MKQFSIQRLSTLLALLVIGTACALAQTMKISGTVTDEMGEPLIGVSVVEKGTSKGGYYLLLLYRICDTREKSHIKNY